MQSGTFTLDPLQRTRLKLHLAARFKRQQAPTG